MMKIRKISLAINLLCGMAAALIFAALFAGCIPFEGSIEEVREKAEGGNGGGGTAVKIYTVTFNINNGNGLTPPAQSANSDSSITLPSGSELTRGGYVFTGWNTQSDGNGTNYPAGFSYTVTGNTTLFAKWSILCTVTFNPNFGLGVPPSAVTEAVGTEITLPGGAGLSREGYTFNGWYTQSGDVVTNYSPGVPYTITSTIVFYAVWSDAYTVTFNINEGSGTAPSSRAAIPGFSITLPDDSGFSRAGYDFDGWNIDADGTKTNYPVGSSYVPGDNITLFARWTSTVTFSVNEGIGEDPASRTVPAGSSITIPSGGGLSKTGYVFNGWNSDAAGMGTDYPAGSSYIPTGNITLYAKWCFTVTFTANSGTPVPANQLVVSGGKISVPPAMNRAGHNFDAWYKEAAFTNKWDFANNTVEDNMPLYARWTYNVTFSVNGGSGTAPTTTPVTAGTSITLPQGTGLSLRGHRFGGWYSTTSGTGGTDYSAGSSYTFTAGNTTLYAKWIKVTDVHLNPDLGSSPTLNAQFNWLSSNALSDTTYNVRAFANENLSGKSVSYTGYTNVTVNLSSSGAERTITLSNSGNLFYIGTGAHLILSFITLRGHSTNANALVTVAGGKLTMGVPLAVPPTITGNTNTSAAIGGGVWVSSGSFDLTNGYITNNANTHATNSIGGGVHVASGATFTMSGGSINNNRALNGGGVFVSGTFTVNHSNVTIYQNTASSGGGVYCSFGTFNMSAGNIYQNKANLGTVGYGGGVYVSSNGSFNMSGGEIFTNEAVGTSVAYGGGVYVDGAGGFSKTGASIIRGYSTAAYNGNVAKTSAGTILTNRGHAAMVINPPNNRHKETTADSGVNLNANSATNWDP